MTTLTRENLDRELRTLLDPNTMPDYCPNGLQVEGRAYIGRMLTGVSATQAFIDTAIARNADAILVHHGLFWKGDPPTLHGFRKARLQAVLGHNLNVFAYHLPLDKHPTLGNNTQLGMVLGWPQGTAIGERGLMHLATLPAPTPLAQVVAGVETALGRTVHVEGEANPQRAIKTVAWCTGDAPMALVEAARAGADLYLTGEWSEPAVHAARESNITLIAAGHHATERYGVKALGEWLASTHGLQVEFCDLYVGV